MKKEQVRERERSRRKTRCSGPFTRKKSSYQTPYYRVGAGEGDSVSSVNVTFFSIHDLEPAPRPRPSMPTLRSWIHTATTLSSLYESKRDLNRSKGASVRRAPSRRLTTESATPAASACCMACFMACPACLARTQPLPLLSHVCLLPNPTSIARTGTFSTIDSLSAHAHRRRPRALHRCRRVSRRSTGSKVCASRFAMNPCC